MAKKSNEIGIPFYIGMAVFALGIITASFFYFSGRDFDPEKHVPTENTWGDMCYNATFKYDFWTCSNSKGEAGLVKWRPKTKCELNPNDGGCVCDELVIDKNYACTCNPYETDCSNESNFLCPVTCIKAHEANECEKGNEDWIWDNRTPDAQECIDAGFDNEMDCGQWEFCRTKTLSDLTCEELKEQYNCDTFDPCEVPRWNKKELLIEFIERCGGTK